MDIILVNRLKDIRFNSEAEEEDNAREAIHEGVLFYICTSTNIYQETGPDNCCFSRPFDNQSQVRIRLETEAELKIQKIRLGTFDI